MSEIKSLTIVNQQGTSLYEVGSFYNRLKLHVIRDFTASGDNFHVPHFTGFTDDNSVVFEAINAPVEVTYA